MASDTLTRPALAFRRRARVIREVEWDRRIWSSDCGHYRVQEIRSHLERRTIVYAQVRVGSRWDILSRHKTREAAEAACRKHARD